MPSIAENLQTWNAGYDWSNSGDEWSAQFGGTDALWWFVLYPRIHQFLPAQTVLELAPGHGRWTHFLRTRCESLIAVDLAEKCIEYCKKRFAADEHLRFHVNDGTSLAVVADNSIDFVFSFDSLVHAEKETIREYLKELSAKLTPEGVGFLHHSNLGSYRGHLKIRDFCRRLPPSFQRYVLPENRLERLLSINFKAWRAPSMTAQLFKEYCEQAGLVCLSQEFINWGRGSCLIDVISIFARRDSRRAETIKCLRNPQFAKNADLTASLAELYCR